MSLAAPLRSLLFVPGDSERKQTKALASPADALILDLEDSVASTQLPAARARVRELLQARSDRSRQQLWVRVNALSSGKLLDDLVAVTPGAPDGIVLPKASSPTEAVEVGNYLAALEARDGGVVGTTRLIVIATETAEALLTLAQYPGTFGSSTALESAPLQAQLVDLQRTGVRPSKPRLVGLTWGSEDLSAVLGASSKHDVSGSLTFTFQLARSLCLITAAASGVQAIDGVYVDFRDTEGLKREVEAARRDGFTGKLAIHPNQVPVINAAFSPSAAEIEHSRRIVAAFAASPDSGVVSLDGQMIDRPHLVQARRILELAAATAAEEGRSP